MYGWLERAIRILVWEPRYFLGSLIVPAVIGAFVLRYPPFGGALADRARWASGILEILGTLVVVYGLLDRRTLFRSSSAAVALTYWLDRVTGLFMPTAVKRSVLAAGAAFGVSSAFGTAGPTVGDNTLASRVKKLEEQVGGLQRSLSDLRKNLTADIERARSELTLAVASVRKEVDDLASKTRALSIGSLGFELMGLTWLLSGIALGTWPQLVIVFGVRPA